jgi:hypothetical protein
MKLKGYQKSTLRKLVLPLLLAAAFTMATTCAVAKISPASGEADFYIAPNGDDRDAGTLNKPFATLQRARDAVRLLKINSPYKAIRVLLRGGRYRLSETVVFSLKDSALEGGTITYEAFPGEKPVLHSGVPISVWQKMKEDPEGLAKQAQGKIWTADLPGELPGFLTLYDGYSLLPRARGPGFIPTGQPDRGFWYSKDQSLLRYPGDALNSLSAPHDAELVIITAAPWTMNILPIESVDAVTSTAQLHLPCTYATIKPHFGYFHNGSAWLENHLSVLDSPGEWVLDSRTRKIYLWPKGDKPGDGIVAPALIELIRIEGKIDQKGPKDTPVRGLAFRGITFTHGDRFMFEKNRHGLGVQHDWEMFDRSTALFRLRGAENCVIENCHFENAGGTAVRLDLHCQDNRVVGNHIEYVGGAGIFLCGYGPGTKDVNKKNAVINNEIHNVGEHYWHSAGIFAWQSGENRIANNLIHHTPYTAIVVSGRIVWDRSGQEECSRTIRWWEVDGVLGEQSGRLDWKTREPFLHARLNIVEYNNIHDVMEVMADGNGVYVSGAGKGNIVRWNHIHDCRSEQMAEGIRCDDDQHETLIQGNIIVRLGGMATGIAIKGKNDIVNNIIANPVSPTKRGMISLELGPLDGSLVTRNIIYTTRSDTKVLFQSRLYGKGPAPLLKKCKADYNLYWNVSDPEWGNQHLDFERKHGIEQHSISANPMFVDPDRDDFRLKKGSPALTIGFVPIDQKQIGLLPRQLNGNTDISDKNLIQLPLPDLSLEFGINPSAIALMSSRKNFYPPSPVSHQQ